MAEPTVVKYSELREKNGKGAILTWQTLCNIFGFDPAPTVTTEIAATAKVEDPTERTPDQIGGPIGPAQGVNVPDPGAKSVDVDIDGDGKPDVTVNVTPTRPEPKAKAELKDVEVTMPGQDLNKQVQAAIDAAKKTATP